MAASERIVFIIGGGPRIGHSVARAFLKEGYKVAVGRRNVQDTANSPELTGAFPVSLDVTKPSSIEGAFREVEAKLGIPNVVVYNAAALTFPPKPDDPFTVSAESFEQDLAVNVSSAYTALQHAVRGFQALKAKSTEGKDEVAKVFIATGNVTPFQPNPIAMTLGSGKAALTYLLSIATEAYRGAGYRFYFASQVTADGGPVPYHEVVGEAHGDVYWRLVKGDVGQTGWDLRFTASGDGKAKVTEG